MKLFVVRLSSSVRGDFTAPAQVAELYIDLLCRYNCTTVVEFLKTNENYRVDETLKVMLIDCYVVHCIVDCIGKLLTNCQSFFLNICLLLPYSGKF